MKVPEKHKIVTGTVNVSKVARGHQERRSTDVHGDRRTKRLRTRQAQTRFFLKD
jgi:hypothetical protein